LYTLLAQLGGTAQNHEMKNPDNIEVFDLVGKEPQQ